MPEPIRTPVLHPDPRPETDNGVEYRILRKTAPSGSPESSMSAEIDFLIAWADIEDFYDWLWGMTYVPGMGFATELSQNHPDWPWLRAVEVRGVALMEAAPPREEDEDNYPDGAKITVVYRGECLNINYGIPGDPEPPDEEEYFSHHASAGFDMMSVPTDSWKWENGATAIKKDMDLATPIITSTHTLTWHNVRLAEVPWAALGNIRGCVNKYLWLGADPETLLYAGYEYQLTRDNLSKIKVSITMTFLEKRIVKFGFGGGVPIAIYGWNHQRRSGAGVTIVFDKPRDPAVFAVDSDLAYTFRRADFAPLIMHAAP